MTIETLEPRMLNSNSLLRKRLPLLHRKKNSGKTASTKIYWLLIIVALFALGCNGPEEVINKVKDKLSRASSISYKYNSEMDNRFNETHYSDSATITYYTIDNSLYGFGLYASSKNEEYLFDGNNFEKLKHDDKLRVQYDRANIASDSSYFYNLPFFASNPIRIQEYLEFDAIIDSIINGQAYVIYKDENQTKSKSDSTEIVKYQKFFYVEVASSDITRIRDIIIRSGDTLQVVDHYFTNYNYKNVVGDAPTSVEGNIVAYKTINEADEYEEFTYEPIKEGAMLSKSTYVDIDNNEVQIFGASSNSSIILFSFIGCTYCEVLLRELREAEYNFTDKVDLYYSSFQNKGSSLKGYLQKKGFPFKAFGQESNMIAEFSLYYSPSFAWIDADGKILKVMEGYDEEMRDTLLGILLKE